MTPNPELDALAAQLAASAPRLTAKQRADLRALWAPQMRPAKTPARKRPEAA